MGYIYKISNTINSKVYIGKTTRDIETRWREHKKDALVGNTKLYRSIRKHKLDNFYISMIEECNDDIINDREKYYISYYDSYKNGYNSTLGGEDIAIVCPEDIISLYYQGFNQSEISSKLSLTKKTVSYYMNILGLQASNKKSNFDHDLIIFLYQDGYKCNEIAKILNCSSRNIGYILTKNNIPHGNDVRGNGVIQLDDKDNGLNIFGSQKEAALFLIKNNFTSAASKTVGGHIGQCCKGQFNKCYGFKWKYK